MPVTVHAIHRYPVKGLGAEALPAVELAQGEAIPGDRRHALARAGHAAAAQDAGWQPKRCFIALDSCPQLAAVSVRRAADGHALVLQYRGAMLAAGDPDDSAGRLTLEGALSGLAGAPAKLVGGPVSRFTDARQALLSIACLSSADDLAAIVGHAVDIRRFRANLILAGGLPWQELDWVGETLTVGALKLRVVEPILRCAAIRANPGNGDADVDLLRPLARRFDEPLFGVYAEVVAGGRIAVGASVTVPERCGRLRDRSALGVR